MLNTIKQWVSGLAAVGDRQAVQPVLTSIGDRMSSTLLNSAALAIKTGGSAIVKGGAAFYAFANGIPVTKAINTDMAALSGTVVNATFNVFCFYIDSAGTLTSQMGTAGATFTAVVFPTVPVNKAWIGFVVINPTGTGNFVGGTTALDDATVVPNAVYVNSIGPIDQTILVG